jgi:hypothetical protein
MGKKQGTKTFADMMEGIEQPISANNVPEQYTPFISGNEPTKKNPLEGFNMNFPDPYRSKQYVDQGGKYFIGTPQTAFTSSVKGENQPWPSKLLNGLIGNTIAVSTKVNTAVGEIGGGLFDLLTMPIPGVTEERKKQYGTATPHLFENFYTEFIKHVENDIVKDKLFPVYGGQAYNTDNLISQMGDMKLWSSDLADAVAFTVAAYTPVAALSKVSTLMKLGKNASKIFQTIATSGWNTVQEASLEAQQGLQDIRETLSADMFKSTYAGLSKEQQAEVNQKAGSHAANIFNTNLAILAGPNLIQARFFIGPVKSSKSRLMKGVLSGKVTKESIGVAKSVLKQSGLGIVSEGAWEEGSQQAVQDYEKNRALGMEYDNRLGGYAYQWLNNFYTTEGQKSMFLGAIVGGGMGARSGIVDARADRKFVEEYSNKYQDALKNRFPLYDNVLPNNIKHFLKSYNKETTDKDGNKAIGKTVLNERGEIEPDVYKMGKLFAGSMQQKSLFSNLAMANLNMDEVHEKFFVNEGLLQMFYKYMSDPIFDDSNIAFDTMMEREGIKALSEDEELSKLGFDYNDLSVQLHKMKTEWDNIHKKLYSRKDLDNTDQENEFKRNVVKGILYERMKLHVLDDIEQIVEDKDQLDPIRDDARKYIDMYEDKSERNKLFEEYTKETSARIDLIKQLKDQYVKDPASVDTKKLEYLIEEESMINGSPVTNDRFSLIQRPEDKTGEFGLRNQYYLNIGMDAIAGARLQSAINNVQDSNGTLKEAVDILTKEKYDVRKEDIQAVKNLIPIERKRVESNRYTSDMFNADISALYSKQAGGEMTGEEVRIASQELEKQLEESDIIVNDMEDAIDRLNAIDPKSDGKGLLNYMDGMPRHITDDYSFMRKVADVPINEADDLIKTVRANPDSYDKVRKVEELIERLNDRKNIYKKTELKQRLDNKAFKGYIKSIDDILKIIKKEILPVAEKNYTEKQNTDSRHQVNRNHKRFEGLGMTISDIDEVIPTDSDIYNAIISIIGNDELKKILASAKEASELGNEYSFNEIFVDRIIASIKQKEKEKKTEGSFKRLIESKYNTGTTEIENLYMSYQTKATKSDREMIKKYKRNPKKLFKTVIEFIVGYKRLNTSEKFAIDRYYINNDILEFRDNISNETDIGYTGLTKEQILSFINKHIQVEALQDIISDFDNDYDIKKQIKAENDAYIEMKKAPTNQQVTVIRSAVKWALSPLKRVFETDKKYHRFKTWLFIRGNAGTGKTQFVMKFLTRCLSVKSNEIFAVAPHQNAADMIDKSLVTSNKTTLIKDLTVDSISNDIKFVLIDEVAALTNPELIALSNTLQAINEKRQVPFRVIAFGDPSQASAQEEGTTKSFDPVINRNMTDGIEYLEVTDPLTVRHRSIIPEINELLDIYEGNDRIVAGLTVYASNMIGYESIGVHAGTLSDMDTQLKVHNSNGKTKAIVVFSNKEKANMISRHPDMTDNVYTYTEVAGQEFGEVYVDLSRNQFRDNSEFNKAFYTSISRSQQYIFFNDKGGTFNNQAKQSIKDKYDKGDYQKEQSKIFDARKKEYEKRLEFDNNVLSGIKTRKKEEKVVIKKGTESAEEDQYIPSETEDVTGKEEPDSNANMEKIEQKITSSAFKHILAFPSYIGSKFIRAKGNTSKLLPNSEVIYVKTEDKTNEHKYTIHILGQLYDNNNQPLNNRYAHLGIVSEEELASDFGQKLMSNYEKSFNKEGEELFNTITIDRTSDVVNLTNSKGEEYTKTILATGKLALAQPLTYKYSDKITYKGEGFIDKVIDLFSHRYLDRAKEKASYSIVIYTNNNKPAERFAGVPYLIIEPVSKKGLKKDKQYISLNPRNISSGNRHIKVLRSFTEEITKLEEYVGSKLGISPFNEMITMFSRNFHIEGDDITFAGKNLLFEEYNNLAKRGFVIPLDKKQFNHVAETIEPIIKGLYSKDKIKKRIKNEDEMKKLYKLDENNKSDDAIYEFRPATRKDKEGNIIDKGYGYVYKFSLANKEDKGTYEYEDGLKIGGGEAQVSLNVIAKANHYVNSKSIRVKTKKRRTETGALMKTATYVTTAKSLLDTNEYSEGYYRMVRELFKENNINIFYDVTFKDGSTRKVEDRYITDDNIEAVENYLIDEGIKTREELDELKNSFITEPITSDRLRDISMFDGDEHPELRTPLEKDGKWGINTLGEDIEANKEILEQLLQTNIEDILQTDIHVAVDENTAIDNEPEISEEKKEKDLGKKSKEVASRIFKGIRKKLLSGIPILGKRIYESDIIKIIRKSIPGIGKEGVVFLEKQMIDRLADEEAWGLYEDGIIYLAKNDDGTVYENIARHEVFHKIYNEYLTAKERKEIDDMAQKEFKDYDKFSSIEELLAVKYHEWKRGRLEKISDYFKNLFKRIMAFLGIYENNIDSINDLFYKIENGFVDYRYSKGDNTRRLMKDIKKEFGTINNYIESCDYVLAMLGEYRENGINGIPSERGEIIDEIIRDTINRIDTLRKLLRTSDEPAYRYELDRLLMITKNMKDIVNDLFPGFNNYADGLYRSTIEEEELESIIDEMDEDEVVNLNKHIIENSKLNSEVDISDDIREFISYIKNDDGEFVSWRYAYIKLLGMLEGVNLEDDNFIDQILEKFKVAETDKGVSRHDMNTNETAVFKTLQTLKNIIDTNTYKAVRLPMTVRFVSGDTFFYSNKSVEDVNSISDARVLSGEVSYTKKNKGESSKDFFNRITKLSDISKEKIIQIYKKEQARLILARLTSHFNSHRQRDPKIGTIKSSFGGHEVKYFDAKGNAVTTGVRSAIASQIANKFQEKTDIEKFINGPLRKWNDAYYKDPLSFVKDFFRYIGLSEYSGSLKNKSMSMIMGDINAFFTTASQEMNKPQQSEKDDEVSDTIDNNEVDNTVSIGKILSDEGSGMLTRLTAAVSLMDNLSRILSSQDGKGHKRYNAVLSTQIHKKIFGLINSRNIHGVGDNKFINIRSVFNNKFFQKNIFINGLNKIYSIIDHDGTTRTYRNDNIRPIMYESEKIDTYNQRTFGMGFLGMISTSRKNNPRYIQFIYPNERQTPFGVDINVLKPDKLIKAIEATITQMVNRNAEKEKDVENYNSDSVVGFEVLREVIGDRKISEIKKNEIPGIAKKIYNILDKKSYTLTDNIIKSRMPLDSSLPKRDMLNKLIDKELYPEWSTKVFPVNRGGYLSPSQTWDQFEAIHKDKGITRENAYSKGFQREYNIKNEHLQPLVSLFYINNYVNGYHFAQLAAGDLASFKDSDNLSDRLSLAFSPGKTGLVNDKYGMRAKARIAVIDDPVNDIKTVEDFLKTLLKEEDVADVLKLFDPEGSMPADSQGFMLPERRDDINYGFGDDMGSVLKPSYYSYDIDGIARAIKYSSVVLTDDLCDRHPALSLLRNKMRKKNIDEVIFNSALKLGNPIVKNDWYKLTDASQDIDIDDLSVFDIDNRDFRIQLDPAAKLDAKVSHPTQLSYMLRLYGINDEQAIGIYNSISKIIESNQKTLSEWTSGKSFVNILKNFTNKKGQENLYDLLMSGINHNFPSIADRSLVHYISSVFKKAVKVVYNGSKLVLQTAKGIEKNYKDIKLPDHLQRELQYKKDKNGRLYAECIIPEGMLPADIENKIKEYLKKDSEPEDLFMFLGQESKDMIGFRIPSSDLHSAVAIKVAGFYDSKGTNIIVAPEMLIPITGSDFDIDSLFVIKRSYVKAYSKTIPVGYIKKGDKYVFDGDASFLNNVDNKLLREVTEAYYTNAIMEGFINIITDEKNIKRMLSPISFVKLKGEKDRMIKATRQQKKKRDISDTIQAQEIHNDIFTGEVAIGMFMNMVKGFAFLHKAEKGAKITHLKETASGTDDNIKSPVRISFNDRLYNEMTDIDEAGEEVGFRFDSLGNAALDNRKQHILSFLNISRETLRPYSILVMHGVKTETINNFISQPILRSLSKYGYGEGNRIKKSIEELVTQNEIDTVETFYDTEMEKYLKYTPEDIDVILSKDKITPTERKFLIYQARVYDMYTDLNKIGNDIASLSKITNVNRKFPNSVDAMETILSSAKKIMGIPESGKITDTPNDDKSDFPYYVSNFWTANPHVYSALKSMQWTVDNINQEYISYGKQFRSIANKVYNNTKLKLDQQLDISKKKIRDEFTKFLMSTLIDRKDIDPVTITVRGEQIVLTDIAAFNRSFIDLIKQAKKDDYMKKIMSQNKSKEERYNGNIFLNTLSFASDAETGQEKIIFHGPATMDIGDLNLFRESFEEMNNFDYVKKNGVYEQVKKDTDGYSQFQKMFVTYAMLNYGMNFGLRNYSIILPGDIYKEESDKLVALMADINNLKTNEINNVVNVFEAQLISNFPESAQSERITIKPHAKTIVDPKTKKWMDIKYGKNPDGIYYDRWFESEIVRTWPKYHVESFGKKFKIFKRTSPEEGLAVYYTRIGTKNRIPIYSIHSLQDMKEYDEDEAFNQKILHVKGRVTKSGLFESKAYDLTMGDKISITDYSDAAKIYPVTYEVIEKKASGIYKVKPSVPIRDKGYYDKPDGEAQRLYDTITKRLRSKEGPFRAGKMGRIYFRKNLEGKGRLLRQQLNKEIFAGYNVIKERVTASGWQVYIDMDTIKEYLFGEQLNLFDKGYKESESKRDIVSILFNQAVDNNIYWNEFQESLQSIDENIEDKINELSALYDGKTVDQLLNDIEGDEDTSSFEKMIIRWMRPYLKNLKPEFVGNRKLKDGRLGEFLSTGQFSLDYNQLAERDKTQYDIDRIILHELMHGLTIIQFKGDSKFRAELKEKIRLLKKGNPALAEEYSYAFSDEEEFISELFTNEKFFNALNYIKIPLKEKNILRIIGEWIMSWFKKGADIRTGDRLMSWIKNNITPLEYIKTEEIEILSRGYEDEEMNKIIDQGLKYIVPINDKGEEEDHYIDIDDKGKIFKRVTDIYNGWASYFRKKGDRKTFGEREADSVWKYTEKNIPKTIDGKEETYDQYKERMDKVMIEASTRARIIHLIDQRFIDRLFNNSHNQGLINSKIQLLAYKDYNIIDSEGKTYTININVDPEKMNWYEENIEKIYKIHGINIFDNCSADLKDILASEVTVASEELGIAGTIDKLIKHADGTYSIKDINTGSNFDNTLSNRLFNYGDQNRQLIDKPRDRKKLQIMTYAFMLKANNPDIKFRNLDVMWIPNSFQATHFDNMRKVEVDDFLNMMKAFLQDKVALKEVGIDEEVYETLVSKSKDIFNVTHYTHGYTLKEEGLDIVDETIIAEKLADDLIVSGDPPHIVAEKKINELRKIIGKAPVIINIGKNKYENLSKTDRVRARMLTSQILQLIKDPQTTLYMNPENDVSLVTQWIGNYYDINNPYVKVWKQFRNKQEDIAKKKHYDLFNEFQSYLKPVTDEYYAKHPTLSKGWLNNLNYKKLYSFAYMEFDNNGSTQERLITENDTEKWNVLTDKQRRLLSFINKIYASYFGKGSYTDEVATYVPEHGQLNPISVIDLFNKGTDDVRKFRYIPGFFPKIPKEDSEHIFDFGEGSYLKGLFSKGYFKQAAHESFTFYLENQYEGRQHANMVLPLKYMGSFQIDNKRDYSRNIEFQFDRFIKSIEYKKAMDPVYAFGESVRGYLDLQNDKDQPMYTNTVKMLEMKLTQDVLGRTIRKRLVRKPIKWFGKEYEDREVKADAVFILMRRWVSATTMWLKPFTGTANGVHANYLKHKDGLKGTIANKIFGIDNDAIDYTLSDSLAADKVYFTEHIVNAMTGKIRQDKTWLLLKKLHYLPDNFDFMSSEKYLLSLRNRMISESTMYTFHRIPEEFVAMTTMIAQLKHLKHPTIKKNGKKVSLWDLYEVEKDANGIYDIVWRGGSRGKIKKGSGKEVTYEDMKELLPKEIVKLKRVYERMQGGYRKEEAAALEVYVLGKVFIQLKKYAPRLLLNAFQSKRWEDDLGMLKATGERHEEEDVYEWMERLNEGRFRILGKFLFSTMMMGSGNREYKWSNMPPEFKQHIIDACLTLGIWATSYTAYLNMFGDDKDDDTLKRMWKMYLLQNLSQQYNPIELLKLTKQMLEPVALTKAIDTFTAMGTLMAAGFDAGVHGDAELLFTDKGDLKGWNNLRKALPGLASYTDAIKRIENFGDIDVQFSRVASFGKYR